MNPETRIDAIRARVGYCGPGSAASRLERLRSEFAPLLGGGTLFVRNQGDEHFLSAHPHDTLQFPRSAPESGRARYRWEDRGDGVLYGFLWNSPAAL